MLIGCHNHGDDGGGGETVPLEGPPSFLVISEIIWPSSEVALEDILIAVVMIVLREVLLALVMVAVRLVVRGKMWNLVRMGSLEK